MSKQASLDLSSKSTAPVECLGQSFPSDAARREHYLKLLAEKLKDPEFRKIEGFPIGEDEDILALSDPPYYTACPNPWIGDFIKHYGRPYDPKEDYHREPFAADVSEGKNHPVYSGHPYHTKVPHRAIMRYILHYTEPGDVVFDGFCGTGMTGVASQLCSDRNEIEGLGFKVAKDGTITDGHGIFFSKLGTRKAILNDLSPIATFVSWNYNIPIDGDEFEAKAKQLLHQLDSRCRWMFVTLHNCSADLEQKSVDLINKCHSFEALADLLDSEVKLAGATGVHRDEIKFGRIHYCIYTDVFTCPECGASLNYWDVAVTENAQGIREVFDCPSCSASLNRNALERTWASRFDKVLDHIVKEKRSELVSVNYSFGSKRFERCATPFDIALSDALTRVFDKLSFPIQRMPDGEESRRNDDIGVTHVHQFYTPRNIATLSVAFDLAAQDTELWLAITGTLISVSRMYRWTPNYEGGEPLSGTLYIPALTRDISAYDAIKRFLAKLPNVHRCLAARYSGGFLASTASMSNLHIPPNSLDYIFLDPPFGANINYSELSFLWEAWLRVITNNRMEAIQNKSQCKGLDEYRTLITKCLESAYTALKPGRWITIEFSNTKAAVWNAIQSAMQEVGFVVANVSSLDKKSRTFKAINSPTAVKQDLVISAYKPTGRLEDRFRRIGHTIEGVWDFLSAHLRNLPVLKLRGGDLEFIGERDPRILYDRMVAFYVGHGVPVPLSSAEFQAALAEKFPEREGMFFLPDQVDIWDKKRAQVQGVGQMSIFVEDEKSAIDWLRSFLKNRPSVVADITPEFMQQLGASWKKFETRPELRVLLEQNFLKYDGNGEVPGQIHGYLSTQFKDLRNLAKDDSHLQSRAKDRWYVPDPGKAVDVEAVRNKRLLAEFWDLCAQAGINRPASEQSDQGRLPFPAAAPAKKGARKKLKEVRTEAVRLGFKECFAAKNYATILALSEHLPENVIEEDEQLQMIHDMADMRAEG